jgi:hypothetical protein
MATAKKRKTTKAAPKRAAAKKPTRAKAAAPKAKAKTPAADTGFFASFMKIFQ